MAAAGESVMAESDGEDQGQERDKGEGDAAGGEASPAPRSFDIQIEASPLGPLKGTVRLIEPPKGKTPSPWVTEVPKAVITLVFASVFGGLVSMAFNYKNWRENQRLDRAKIDMAQAMKTFNTINELAANRIYKTFVLLRNIEEGISAGDKEEEDTRKAITASYKQTVEDWNAKIRLLIKQTEFDIDYVVSPHDGQDKDMVGIVYNKVMEAHTVRCAAPLRMAAQTPAPLDWTKSSWVLAGIHGCFVEFSGKFLPEWNRISDLPSKQERAQELKAHKARLYDIQEHAMTYVHVASANLREARAETQARGFWTYIRDW
jgi:hypothetical protein